MDKLLCRQCFVLVVCLVVCVHSGTPRTISFVNECEDDHYLFVTTNAVGQGCTSQDQCPAGSTCAYPDAPLCYYTVPTPASGNFLIPSGGTNSITIPYIDNGNPEHWAGNFAFCNNQCTGTAASCLKEGCGVYSGPYNFVEVTLEKNIVDSYDISNINGINVPLTITPDFIESGMVQPHLPYQCGNPGGVVPNNGISPSSWEFKPPSFHYQWVLPSDDVCAQDSDCPSGQVCGLSNDPGKFVLGVLDQFQFNCGKIIGYWSTMELCGEEPDQFITVGPFNCELALVNGVIPTTLGAMQACSGTSGSGYLPGADTEVCGCADWISLLGPGAIPPQTANCTRKNPLWVQYVLPTIQWIKAACPSCYSYPKDDPSSTFTCGTIDKNGYNSQNYTITLCPTPPAGSSTSTSTSGKSPTSGQPHSTSSTTSKPTPTSGHLLTTSSPLSGQVPSPSFIASAARVVPFTTCYHYCWLLVLGFFVVILNSLMSY